MKKNTNINISPFPQWRCHKMKRKIFYFIMNILLKIRLCDEIDMKFTNDKTLRTFIAKGDYIL